ncbi:MAG: hypothetical protein CMJ16_04755 [Peredibacter sp.]|nr:hypothetical protein [Peredibacter sp.]|tara:strand:+ start:6482 stop:6883 length:402 start_codon:yes stop_codon:yes gene_type:complete
MKNKIHFKVFRVMLSLIFVVAGFGHLFSPNKLVHRLEASPGWPLLQHFFDPTFLIVATGAVLLAGGIGLMFNLKPQWSSLALMGVLIPITLTAQTSVESLGPLFKNVAIMGGLILVFFENRALATVNHNHVES